jgi:hypothetical protein
MCHFSGSLARACCQLLFLFSLLLAVPAWASVSGSISGTVKDPAGKVVPGASVIVTEVDTGLSYQARSNGGGFYTLPVLPVGKYELLVQAPGFGSYQRTDITLNNNAELNLDVDLKVGNVAQNFTVTDNSIHVETARSQMGEVISGRQMASIPLNGRSFTDLLSMQPGVAPQSAITSTTVQDVGATVLAPSGTLNPGTISVNGQPEGSNVFIVNGSNAEEDVNSAKRRFFYGPGTLNFDIAAAKTFPFRDAKSLLFRIEAFNTFNHAQFSGPSSIDGDIGSSTFGNAISAAPARIMQAAVKFAF